MEVFDVNVASFSSGKALAGDLPSSLVALLCASSSSSCCDRARAGLFSLVPLVALFLGGCAVLPNRSTVDVHAVSQPIVQAPTGTVAIAAQAEDVSIADIDVKTTTSQPATVADQRQQRNTILGVQTGAQTIWNDVRPWIIGSVIAVAIVMAGLVVIVLYTIKRNSYAVQKPVYEQQRNHG